MALLKDMELSNGLSVNQAYHRIEERLGIKTRLTLTVRVYRDNEAADSFKQPIAVYTHSFTPSVETDAPNDLIQGYNNLKTELLIGAIDC